MCYFLPADTGSCQGFAAEHLFPLLQKARLSLKNNLGFLLNINILVVGWLFSNFAPNLRGKIGKENLKKLLHWKARKEVSLYSCYLHMIFFFNFTAVNFKDVHYLINHIIRRISKPKSIKLSMDRIKTSDLFPQGNNLFICSCW